MLLSFTLSSHHAKLIQLFLLDFFHLTLLSLPPFRGETFLLLGIFLEHYEFGRFPHSNRKLQSSFDSNKDRFSLPVKFSPIQHTRKTCTFFHLFNLTLGTDPLLLPPVSSNNFLPMRPKTKWNRGVNHVNYLSQIRMANRRQHFPLAPPKLTTNRTTGKRGLHHCPLTPALDNDSGSDYSPYPPRVCHSDRHQG